ncbi:hypothetical protein LNTAR_16142 [Lentisphaera araneosa HTCC2155]|uniref:Uncharacterized protein n=1 Tax=Lentisphaera araneosa HTCC2155 TaxID=313628 RepID=A6DMM6_9BACT|nr:hypothetical protein [Lentisphaera araneosa]EDM27216.1 hypothetical protein LNTAR_16142 [Lentisphaera araneosa HTCC2155]
MSVQIIVSTPTYFFKNDGKNITLFNSLIKNIYSNDNKLNKCFHVEDLPHKEFLVLLSISAHYNPISHKEGEADLYLPGDFNTCEIDGSIFGYDGDHILVASLSSYIKMLEDLKESVRAFRLKPNSELLTKNGLSIEEDLALESVIDMQLSCAKISKVENCPIFMSS